MKRNSGKNNLGPSQRQLKVGEEIRHLLSTAFMRGDFKNASALKAPITVTEVRMSGDLRHANAFIMPLSGIGKQSPEEVLDILKACEPSIRHGISKKLTMKFLPKIIFRIDTTFDEAEKISRLLHNERVQKDLKKED